MWSELLLTPDMGSKICYMMNSRCGGLFYIMAPDVELFTDQNGFVNESINQSRILPGGASS